MAKVIQSNDSDKPAPIPAGIEHGTELYAVGDGTNGLNFMMEGRHVRLWYHLSREVRRAFIHGFFLATKEREDIQRVFGLEGIYHQFMQWRYCKFGAYDDVPDYNRRNKRLTPDLNTHCRLFDCPLYGKLCKSPYNLKGAEVKTIIDLSRGNLPPVVADMHFITTNGVDKRVRKLMADTDSANRTEMCKKVMVMLKMQ